MRYVLDCSWSGTSRTLTCATGTFALTGKAATLTFSGNRTLACGAGAFALTGHAAALNYSGGGNYYVATDGSNTGAGTIGDPWTLRQAIQLGGYPAGTLGPGDTVWIRGDDGQGQSGLYVPPLTTANMAGTTITKVFTIFSNKFIKSTTNPWVAGDVGKNITVYGVGANGEDLVTTVKTFVSAGEVELNYAPTLGTEFRCPLSGSAGNPIIFRAYPGERVTIDGNFDSDAVTSGEPIVRMMGGNGYIWLWDVETKNTNTFRGTVGNPSTGAYRGDSVAIWPPGCKVINCVCHDDGEAFQPVKTAEQAEFYGNITYHGGYYSIENEKDVGVAIDLIPAGSSPIQTIGTASGGIVTSGTLTFSHTHPTGANCLVVAAGTRTTNLSYTGLAVTFNGVAMNLAAGHWHDAYGPVALFYLAVAGDNTPHNVVVTFSGADSRKMGVAQSFTNVHQTTPPSTGWDWQTHQFVEPPTESRVTVQSATNHMVVDALNVWGAYAGSGYPGGPFLDYAVDPASDNTLVRWSSEDFALNEVGMSCAPGAASVEMGWKWTGILFGHGHSIYPQIGTEYGNGVTIADNTHVTCASNPWVASDVGKTFQVEYGMTGGGHLVTTIESFVNAGEVVLADAPQVSLNPADFKWSNGITIKDNIFYTGVGANAISAQGTSGGIGLIGSLVEGNLCVDRAYYLGGAGSQFVFAGTTFTENYAWNARLTIDYNTSDFSGLVVTKNYIHNATGVPVGSRRKTLVIGGTGDENTFIGLAASGPSGSVVTQSGVAAISRAYGGWLWYTTDVGAKIKITGAGVGGADLLATISGWNSSTSVNVDPAPSTTLALTAAVWDMQTHYPDNTYYVGSTPTTNHVVVRANDYEANRANIYVFNWEDLDNVSVNLDGVVANGTPIYIMNAQDYFAAPVYTGTYTTGVPVSLPMGGLTEAAIEGGYDATHYIAEDDPVAGPTGRAFNAFVVRAQSAEIWR